MATQQVNGWHPATPAERITSTMASSPLPGKVFNDAIHGSIELPLLCVRIIDTPQFQRLRFVKQVGTSYYLYPAASHNRFEHCLGVAFLAGQFVEQLRRTQPELAITDQDLLCVQVAGLCHDLGHGPFSHLWQEFVEESRQDWKHEVASAAMLDHLLLENTIDVTEFGLDKEQDVTFIKELFLPTKEKMSAAHWTYRGRGKEKSFLYHIVANSVNGVDVDKFDYIQRDIHNLGLSVTFDYKRLMMNCRVVEVPDTKLQSICWRDKEAENVFELFSNRCQLHKKAYQHRVSQVINIMVSDVFRKANDHLTYKGNDGKHYRLSDTVTNMAAYSQLTDDMLMQVLRLDSEHKDVDEAKKIVRQLFTRKLYSIVGNTLPLKPPKGDNVTKKLRAEMMRQLNVVIDQNNNQIVSLYKKAKDSVEVYDTKLSFCNGENNPLDRIWFYSKKDPSKVHRIEGDQVSTMMPRRFLEVTVRVSSRSDDEDVIKLLQEVFRKACEMLDFKMSEEDRSPSH